MPLYKRIQFVPLPVPSEVKADTEVFFHKLTNEIFMTYEEYFERVILCNSLVWTCSLTGKPNLTFQEAVGSEESARRSLHGFPKPLKKALFYLTNLTQCGKFTDTFDNVYSYAKEHYFKGEVVLAVIGNLWCHSRVTRVIPPTQAEIDTMYQEKLQKNELTDNDYLTDSTWGPPPELFRYEVEETEPDDPNSHEVYILESLDVKREKNVLTRDKCKYLIKLATYYSVEHRAWKIKEEIARAFNLSKTTFEDLFVGAPPIFVQTPGSSKPPPVTSGPGGPSRKSGTNSSSASKSLQGKDHSPSSAPNINSKTSKVSANEKTKSRVNNSNQKEQKPGIGGKAPVKRNKGSAGESKAKKQKIVLTPEQLKQIELEKKMKEREALKAEKKTIADFKKLWFKPKEDLEVDDLQPLPTPDPVCTGIPNELFGDFMMVLEFFNTYSGLLKLREYFPGGLTFQILESALLKNEIAGPLSEILQLLLKAIFNLQKTENAEITQEEAAAAELEFVESRKNVTVAQAIEQATSAATWSNMYQNTSLFKLSLDHFSLTEILRLHLLSSGARPSEKDVKWRYNERGGYGCQDDPGLQLRLQEPQILKTLSQGSVFDLNVRERLKLIDCLIAQILTYSAVRDIIEESFEEFKQARISLRSLQAAEKRYDIEDNFWKHKLRTEKVVPGPDFMSEMGPKNPDEAKELQVPKKPVNQLSDARIEEELAKKEKEIAKRKRDYDIDCSNFQASINKHERRLGINPVGRDRAYRRYWIFSSVPALFVERDHDTVGTCLSSPTPYMSEVNIDDIHFVRSHFQRLLVEEQARSADKEGSDKENSTIGSPKKPTKKKGTLSSLPYAKDVAPHVFGVCSGDPDSCSVHGRRSKFGPKWSFFWNSEQIDELIQGLSPRGIREKDLRVTLQEEYSGITGLLKRTPVRYLNVEKHYPEDVIDSSARSLRKDTGGNNRKAPKLHPNLNFPSDTDFESIMELQLRDLILETEEKVFLGGLGSLKVDDRLEWRHAIENRNNDSQTSILKWGESKTLSNVPLTNGSSSGKSSPTELDSVYKNASTSKEFGSLDCNINPLMRCLASSILQLEQCVEPKFIKKPLGDDSKKKCTDSTWNDVVLKSSWTSGTPLERWETSLMKSTTYSQLFLHLFTLDNSIEWSRSVLNARCRVCRRKGDADNMILCDGCNKGHHSYCLQPPLEVIPKEDWFCTDCKPPELPPRAARPNRKKFLEEDEEDEEESNESESENEAEEEEDDEEIQNSREHKRRSSGSGDEDDGDRDVDSEVEVCAKCTFGGEVICCDRCPRVYHLQCLDPPKTRVPRGTWYCPECDGSTKDTHQVDHKNGKQKKNVPPKFKKRMKLSDSEEDEGEDSENPDESGGEDDENDPNSEDEEEEVESEPEHRVVKMQFNSNKPKPSSSRPVYHKVTSESESEEEDPGSSRQRVTQGLKVVKRKCHDEAIEKIHQATKRLRSDSKENETSESSTESNSSGSRPRKRSADIMEDFEAPKLTRGQRKIKNRCGEAGDLDNVLLDQLLVAIMKHPSAYPFLKPVTKAQAPDYHQIVKEPMDLGTIKYKLNSMVYTCSQELLDDLRLVFENCFLYNPSGSQIYSAGEDLKNFCQKRCRKLGVYFMDSDTD